MRVWGKAQAEHKETATVARAAVDGKSRQQLLKQAVAMLLVSADADRVGVWVESVEEASGGPWPN
jgi:hypothetical protein